MKQITIISDTISFEALENGGIITNLTFIDKNNCKQFPLYKAPWIIEGYDLDTFLLQYLQGEFLCLPFGGGRKVNSPNWIEDSTIKEYEDLHGYGANHKWNINEIDQGVHMNIVYPEDHPIDRIEKEVTLNENTQSLDITIKIRAKYDIYLPIGIHPNIALDYPYESVKLELPYFKFGYTLPSDTEDGISLLKEDTIFYSLEKVPLKTGKNINLTKFPILESTEEIIQLCGIESWIKVHFPTYSIEISWNLEVFPSLLLWISNKGRSYEPWNSRNICLGIEPMCGAFDLLTGIATSSNPINKKNIPTSRLFTSQEQSFQYSIKKIS